MNVDAWLTPCADGRLLLTRITLVHFDVSAWGKRMAPVQRLALASERQKVALVDRALREERAPPSSADVKQRFDALMADDAVWAPTTVDPKRTNCLLFEHRMNWERHSKYSLSLIHI